MLAQSNDKPLLSVREVIQAFGLSRYTVYTLIRTDPSFPCVNVGPRKNYRIQKNLLIDWFALRLEQRKNLSFQIPSFHELMQTGRK